MPDFLSFLLEAAQFLLGYLSTLPSAQTRASCLDATQSCGFLNYNWGENGRKGRSDCT